MLFLNTSTQAHWQEWIPWWWLRILHFRYLRTSISIQNRFISASAIRWWHRIITVIIIHRPDYTAEFLPIISPLRICTPLPSNSTDEFIFPPTSGNVFNGCFSSSLWCAWAARFIERWKQVYIRETGKKWNMLFIDYKIGIMMTKWNYLE